MITVKLVRIISGFVLTEHPHLALMYGGHHPNIDYSYRAKKVQWTETQVEIEFFWKSPGCRDSANSHEQTILGRDLS